MDSIRLQKYLKRNNIIPFNYIANSKDNSLDTDIVVYLCCIAKNEDLYIEDWIVYHFNIGFDEIVIYDNNDEERKEDLKKLLKNSSKISSNMRKHIHIKKCNGYKFYQKTAYFQCYQQNEFDWIAFIDIDEYIVLNNWSNIKAMLNDTMFDNCEGIVLGWNLIGDDDIIEPKEDISTVPIYKRLFKSVKKQSNWGKSIIRSNIPICKNSAHYFFKKIATNNTKLIKYYNTKGQYVKEINTEKIMFQNCYLNHYRTKTLKEYLDTKFKNKFSATGDIATNDYDYFFTLNKKTPEKIEYIENYIRTHNNKTLYVFPNNPTVKQLQKYRNEYKYIIGDNNEIDILTLKGDLDKIKQSFANVVYIE